MRVLSQIKTLPKNKYYEMHLNILNAFIPDTVKLTPKEIEVLAMFMGMEGDIANDRFGTTAKKMVKEELNLSDGGLGNYMKALRKKNFITTINNALQVHPSLQCSPTEQEYSFKLNRQQ